MGDGANAQDLCAIRRRFPVCISLDIPGFFETFQGVKPTVSTVDVHIERIMPVPLANMRLSLIWQGEKEHGSCSNNGRPSAIMDGLSSPERYRIYVFPKTFTRS